MNKLDNVFFKDFFKKWLGINLPSSDTFRSLFTDEIFEDCIEKVVTQTKDKLIYSQIDETTDASGRSVGGLIIGSMGEPDYGPFVVHLKNIETSCNTAAYKKFYLEGLSQIYPESE